MVRSLQYSNPLILENNLIYHSLGFDNFSQPLEVIELNLKHNTYNTYS